MQPNARLWLSRTSSAGSWERKTWWSITMRLHCCALAALLLFADVLQAQQFVWRNDSLAQGQNGFIQAGFVNGEIGAAVFDVPCGFLPLQIQSVQVFWRSQAGATTQVMTHVRVYPSTQAGPGSPLYSGEGAMMTAGYMNEFSSAGLGWTLSQSPFVVGVEYVTDLEQPVSSASGHLVTDADGCQPGKNLLSSPGGSGWADLCSLGMSGDLVIRVKFQAMGAGCFGDSECNSRVDLRDVAAEQRCFSGPGVAALLQCLPFDCNADGDVDLTDHTALRGCLAGPATSCNSACAGCVVGSSASDSGHYRSRLIARTVDVLRNGSSDYAPATRLMGALPGDGTVAWTPLQVAIAIAIVALILVAFLGPCWSASCRSGLSGSFMGAGTFPDLDDEMPRIRDALDWLQNVGDSEAEEAWFWYSEAGAYNSEIFGVIQVNHWADRQGMVARRLLNKVVVHEEFVTGPSYSRELLGLILFMEWQHIDDPQAIERTLESRAKAFRQRVGLSQLRPEIQHGPSEGGGG